MREKTPNLSRDTESGVFSLGNLKAAFLFGLVIVLVIAAMLFFLSREGGFPLFSFGRGGTSFSRMLEDYDGDAAGLSPRGHASRLDALEKKALTVENTLSVLKRRRVLARSAPARSAGTEPYAAAYAAAAVRARGLYPGSGQIAACAADSLAGRPYNEDSLIVLANAMTESGLGNLALDFSVYSGLMDDPALARELPRELFVRLCAAAKGEEKERYLVNAALRTLLGGAGTEAREEVNAIFAEQPRLDQTWRFGAEFFYDHGDFERAAELFAHFSDGVYLARQADALYLAGFTEPAAALWQAASGSVEAEQNAKLRSRALYNLASVSAGPGEAENWLAAIFQNPSIDETAGVYARISYSRLSPRDQALTILERAGQSEALYALELLRRNAEIWTVGKTVAAAWLLVNEHPADPRIAEWAAWYFDLQKQGEETALLLAGAERNGIQSPRFAFHRALERIRERDDAGAERILRALGESRYGGYWQAPASLALIAESRRDYHEALPLYETAAALQAPAVNRLRRRGTEEGGGTPPEMKEAARIQLRIARIERVLGQEAESRRALDYAFSLDPDNPEASLESRRLTRQGAL